MLAATRADGSTEDNLVWPPDPASGEAYCRVRAGTDVQNLSAMRAFVVSLRKKVTSIKAKRKIAGSAPAHVLRLTNR